MRLLSKAQAKAMLRKRVFAEFGSLAEAARHFGVSSQMMRLVLNNKDASLPEWIRKHYGLAQRKEIIYRYYVDNLKLSGGANE